MTELFLKVLNLSITASWLVLAVFAARLLLKKAPKGMICLLWAAVAVKLICPISFESAVSLVPSAETVTPEIIYEEEPQIDSGIDFVNSTVNPILSGMGEAEPDGEPLMQKIVGTAGVVWAAGMGAMLVYAAVSYVYLLYKTRIRAKFSERVFVCDNIADPFILGFLKPKIFLPSDVDEADAEYIIAHEEAHLKRRDHLWKPLGFLILSIHWFNPLVWAAYIMLCRDIELACDEKVIKERGEGVKTAYTTALINCSTPRTAITACPLAFGEVGVKERVKAVLKYRKHAAVVGIFAFAIIVFVVTAFFTNPHQGVEKLLEPGSVWHCTNYDSEIFVDDERVVEGWLVKDDETIEISVGYNEKYANIFDRPYRLIDGSGSPAKINTKIKIKDGKLILDIITDELELGVESLIYERRENVNNYFSKLDCPVGEEDYGTQLYSEELVYKNSEYDGGYTLGEFYRVLLKDKLQLYDSENWIELGAMQKKELSKESFDKLFTSGKKWYNRESCKSLREGNELALELRAERNGVNELYILMRQVDGIHYMAYGEWGDTPDKDRIFWVKRLEFPVTESETDNQIEGAMVFDDYNLLVFNESPDAVAPTVILGRKDNRFQFYWSALSSYIAIGTYELTDDKLILTTDDDYKNVYVFEKTAEGYAFAAEESAKLPQYKYSQNGEAESPVPDGAVFRGVTMDEKEWSDMTYDINKRIIMFNVDEAENSNRE